MGPKLGHASWRQLENPSVPNHLSAPHPRHPMARFCHKGRRPTPNQTLKRPRNYDKETSFALRTRPTIGPENTSTCRPPTSELRATAVSSPGSDWRRPPGRSHRSWILQLKEDRRVSAREMWRAAENRRRRSCEGSREWSSRAYFASIVDFCWKHIFV